jgi:hypothetical protein
MLGALPIRLHVGLLGTIIALPLLLSSSLSSSMYIIAKIRPSHPVSTKRRFIGGGGGGKCEKIFLLERQPQEDY